MVLLNNNSIYMNSMEKVKYIKKENVSNCALELFSRKGYYQTSIEDIANEANVSKGLFYHYYTSKEELFEEIVIESIESILNFFPKENQKIYIDEKFIYNITRKFISSLKKDINRWKLIVLILSQQTHYEFAIVHLNKQTSYLNIQNVLKRFFDVRGYDKPAVEVKLLISFFIGVSIQYVNNPNGFPIKNVMEEFMKKMIPK